MIATLEGTASGEVLDGAASGDDGRLKVRLLVRVLGTPSVPRCPGLTGKGLALIVYLACHEGPVRKYAVRNALWNGRGVHRKRLANVVSDARRMLGRLDDGALVLPLADGHGSLRVADGVVTDLRILRSIYRHALTRSPAEAINLLHRGLDLVAGPPFDGPGYDWAHHTGLLVADASTLIAEVARRLVDLALSSGDENLARRTTIRALRSLPGDESLYRLRMRVEHQAGNVAAVHVAYAELLTFLAALGIGAQPSKATTDLYHELACGG